MFFIHHLPIAEALAKPLVVPGFKHHEGFCKSLVDVLEDLLLGFRVPVFTRRAKRHLVDHPKFYFFDAGVFRSVRPRGPLDVPEKMAGAALEGLVAQHLRAWIAYSHRNDIRLHYWRTKSGVEVDFVLYGEDTLCAIEVKNARHVYRVDVKPLRAFREDYPQSTVCLLYRGNERLMLDGVLCIPCEEFLRQLIPGKAPVPGGGDRN